MGVLEDAIREHLDLKRRHGASGEELDRQEAEALGPARRDLPESEAEPAEAGHEDAVEPAPEAADLVEPDVDVEPAQAEPASVEPAPPLDEESPVDAPIPPKQDEDPDFGAEEESSRRPPHDLDFE
jgi:hypothetical protein